MKKDFHYAVTYIVARWADFSHKKAQIIAYACQFVDDNCDYGILKFDNGAMCSQIPSSHKIHDYRNFKSLEQYKVWLPFHYLPGNDGLNFKQSVPGSFIKKLITNPNSYIVKDMVDSCIANYKAKSSDRLHRLGITLHTLSDSWAHQGFVGINHRVNDILITDRSKFVNSSLFINIKDKLVDMTNFLFSSFMSQTFPLGHVAALDLPDLPYLKWDYIDDDAQFTRENYSLFVDAAEAMYNVLKQVSPNLGCKPSLSDEQKDLLKQLFISFRQSNSYDRLNEWIKLLIDDVFGIGVIHLRPYKKKGLDSWRHDALGDENNPKFTPEFLRSNWKLFHDALFVQKYTITRLILPKYGICVA